MGARMDFVVFWAEFVRSHSDREWSRQQNVVIDSQFPSRMSRKEYLEMKSNA